VLHDLICLTHPLLHDPTGGGAWNHALYFKHLAPAGSATAATTAISADLSKAITSSFGDVAKMQEELTTAATKQFGSGWAWLCYTGWFVCRPRE
jgi:Fe-Mn family superoxide dismutase